MEMKKFILWLLAIEVLTVCVLAQEHQGNKFESDLESLSIAGMETYNRSKRRAPKSPYEIQNNQWSSNHQGLRDQEARARAQERAREQAVAVAQLERIEIQQRDHLHSITDRLMTHAQQQRNNGQRG